MRKVRLKIGQLMRQRGLQITSLARAVEMRPATVSRLVKEQVERVELSTLAKMGEFFGCRSVSELLEFEDAEPTRQQQDG